MTKPPSPPASFSVRLPENLRIAAKSYADSTGLSLNGLLCVALADYLASRGIRVKPGLGVAKHGK